MRKCEKCGARVYDRDSDGRVMERIWNYEYEDYGDGGDGSPFWDEPHKCKKALKWTPDKFNPRDVAILGGDPSL